MDPDLKQLPISSKGVTRTPRLFDGLRIGAVPLTPQNANRLATNDISLVFLTGENLIQYGGGHCTFHLASTLNGQLVQCSYGTPHNEF